MIKVLTDFLASALSTEGVKPMSTDGTRGADSFADTMEELLASTHGGVTSASTDFMKPALEINDQSVGSEPGAAQASTSKSGDHTFFNQISDLPEASAQLVGASQPQLMNELTMDITKPGQDVVPKSAPELTSTSLDDALTTVTVQEAGLKKVANEVFHATIAELAGTPLKAQIADTNPRHSVPELASTSSDVALINDAVKQAGLEGIANEVLQMTMTDLTGTATETQVVSSNLREGASRLLQPATVIADIPEGVNAQQPLLPEQAMEAINASQQDTPLGGAQTATTQQAEASPLMSAPPTDDTRATDFTLMMVETGRKLAAHSTGTPIKAMSVTSTTNPADVALEGMPQASPTRTAPAGTDWLGLTDRLQFADLTDRQSTKEAKLEALTDRAAVMPATSAALKTDQTSGSQRVMDTGTRVSTVEPQQFGNEMATHVRVLKSRSGGEVKLNLHPAELGRMSISVSTDGNDTRVAFVVETPQARQVVEAAMPRLREMLDSAGLSLSDSDVSEQRNRQSEGSDGGSRQQNGGTSSSDGDDVPGHTAISLTLDPDRLVDTYI